MLDLCPCTAEVLPGNTELNAIEGAEKGAEMIRRPHSIKRTVAAKLRSYGLRFDRVGR
jgi:hypothetical protein